MHVREVGAIACFLASSKTINQSQEFQHEKKPSIVCRNDAQRAGFRR